MTSFVSYLSVGLLVVGSLFVFIGALGLLKMNNFWSRTHATGLIDSPGIVLTLIGILLTLSFSTHSFKIILLLVLLLLTSPVIIHMMCQALRNQNNRDKEPL